MLLGNTDPQIGAILPEERAKSLDLVFGYLPPEERRRQVCEALRGGCASHGASFEGLIGAHRNHRLVGSMFSQLEPGKTAVVWLPRLTAGEPEATAAALLAATWKFLCRRQVVLGQVLLPTVDRDEETRLRLGGMRHLANLLYLVSQNNNTYSTVVAPTAFDLESYTTANHARLANVLDATCEDTLDCPGLESVRFSEDVLLGYRWTGAFNPRHWLIVRHGGHDVGCLLLADHPRHDHLELLYLGLIPAVRGRGWGKQLVRCAQRLSQLAGRRRVVLAVDAANAPATETYMATGFQAWQQRHLYVKLLTIGMHRSDKFSTGGAKAAARVLPHEREPSCGFFR